MSYSESRSEQTAQRLREATQREASSDPQSLMQWKALRRRAQESGGGLEAIPSGDALFGLERVLGRNDLIDVSYFESMSLAAKSVCRIKTPSSLGTGWMITDNLVITNHHVIDRAEDAARSVLEFGFDRPGGAGRPVRLDPSRLFVTSPEEKLDFTIIAIAQSDEQTASPFGRLTLAPETVRQIAIGEPLNIIQHPNGEHKQYAVRENEVIATIEQFLHYKTDTNPGSSGSPVFNNRWQVVALHHSGVPRKVNGVVVNRKGEPWDRSQGENAIDWIANEGVRIDGILLDLKRRSLSEAERKLLGDLLLFSEVPEGHIRLPGVSKVVVDATDAPKRQDTPPPRRPDPSAPPQRSSPVAAPAPSATLAGNLLASFVIPLQVQVSLGPVQLMGSAPAASVVSLATGPAASSAPSNSVERSLRALEAVTPDNYYLAEQDGADREAYYQGIDLEMTDGAALYRALSETLKNTHSVSLSYRDARLEHLYPVVDLVRKDRKIILHSLYTNQEYSDTRGFVNEAFAAQSRFESALESLRVRESSLSEEALLLEQVALEAQAGFNCEHVVPQSWFRKRPPMVSDLHHLFTCDVRCNSTRGNHPLTDFPDFPEQNDNPCGKLEGNRFEPRNGKSAAARAILYFLVRYPQVIRREQYSRADLGMLRRWSDQDPPSEWERHRNAEIFKVQGNRNPFIDFPALVARVDFSAGLGG